MLSCFFLVDDRWLLQYRLRTRVNWVCLAVGPGSRTGNFVTSYTRYYLRLLRGWITVSWEDIFLSRGVYYSIEPLTLTSRINYCYWQLKFMRGFEIRGLNNSGLNFGIFCGDTWEECGAYNFILADFKSLFFCVNNFYPTCPWLSERFSSTLAFLFIQDQVSSWHVEGVVWNNILKYWVKDMGLFWQIVEWWFLGRIFFTIICLIFLIKIFGSYSTHSVYFQSNWNYFIDIYLYSWLLMGENKVESSEEVSSLIILWPWCVFLIFSHLCSFYEETEMIGFAEWGLPVLYGFILLVEHQWSLGLCSLVYLAGVRGRKSLIINVFEDMGGGFIMVARVGLQAVRGVIVGMFHFICREALLVIEQWWAVDNWFEGSVGISSYSIDSYRDLISLISDLILAGGSLVIITAIMFLQLIFLLISVWLFCKCWYISWGPEENKIAVKGHFGLALGARSGNAI